MFWPDDIINEVLAYMSVFDLIDIFDANTDAWSVAAFKELQKRGIYVDPDNQMVCVSKNDVYILRQPEKPWNPMWDGWI